MGGEGPISITLHGLTFGGMFGIFVILLRQHKVWVRMKDRINDLWSDRCDSRKERFVPLDNGRY